MTFIESIVIHTALTSQLRIYYKLAITLQSYNM
jgi:hypothetical protein